MFAKFAVIDEKLSRYWKESNIYYALILILIFYKLIFSNKR